MPNLCGTCIHVHPKEKSEPGTLYHQCTKYKVRIYHFRYYPNLVRATICTANGLREDTSRRLNKG